jgi:hypothetical protein
MTTLVLQASWGGFKDMMVALPDSGRNWIFLVS